MEKNSNDLMNFADIPTEIQQHIAAYLDGSALGFFAQSYKRALKNVLPLIIKHQALFPLRLIAKGDSTYLSQANQLFVCGNNDCGQLGLEDEKDHSIFTHVLWPEGQGKIQHIVAGNSHTLVLTKDNTLRVCGYNGNGQLGLKDEKNHSTFTTVPWPEERGRIRQVFAGLNHTIVLTNANTLWVCGSNDDGQLGLGHIQDSYTFIDVEWTIERGKIQQVVAGNNHTVVLTDTNMLWVCGSNYEGQLGLGNHNGSCSFTVVPWPKERGKIQQVVAGGGHTLVLTDENTLWVCGKNDYGQLGLENNESCFTFTTVLWPKERGRIRQVVAGLNHTIVLTEKNTLWVCGKNDYGQLGLGHIQNCYTFIDVKWAAERGKIQQVVAGNDHTVVLTDSNTLWVCGSNFNGELGLDDKQNYRYPTLTILKQLNKHLTFKSVNMQKLSPMLHKVFTLNNTLNQLIKLGKLLALIPDKGLDALYSRSQPEELNDQPPLKKMRL